MVYGIDRRVANVKLPRSVEWLRGVTDDYVLDRCSLSLSICRQGQASVSTNARKQQKRERKMVALRHKGFLCAPITGAADTIRSLEGAFLVLAVGTKRLEPRCGPGRKGMNEIVPRGGSRGSNQAE